MSFRFRLGSIFRTGISRGLLTTSFAGLGIMGMKLMRGNAEMVAPYAFGGHLDGSSSYPKKPVIPSDCIIVAGSSNKALAQEIAAILGCKLADIETGKFKDGESYFEGSVEGKNVILICPQSAPANDSIFETLLLVSSLKRNGAKSISLYLPYACYARQDKMVGPWRSLAFSDLATYYENSGVDRVVTVDIHNEAVMGCFQQSINASNLTAVKLASKYISEVAKLNNMVVLSPDEGGVKRAKKFFDDYQTHAGNENSRFVIMIKNREKPNQVAEMTLTGDVQGRDCILIDDMIDTGGTMIKAAHTLKEHGARNVYVFATHGIFNHDFYDRINDSTLAGIFITNTLSPPGATANSTNDTSEKVKRISVSKLLADHIYRNCMTTV